MSEHSVENGLRPRYAMPDPDYAPENASRFIVAAINALTEEQRTANLLSVLTTQDTRGQHAFTTDQMALAIAQIEERLDLRTTPIPSGTTDGGAS